MGGRACLALFWRAAATAATTAATTAVVATAAVVGAMASERAETRLGSATAWFDGPTTRYGHNVLGDLPEWERLCLAIGASRACHRLGPEAVFEDIVPRLADLDGDGRPEALVVESTVTHGAALVVYTLADGHLIRQSLPPIGRRNRWLAPIGIADLTGDGHPEIAYVETPHLGKRLKIWSWRPSGPKLIFEAAPFSNHRIGERHITSAFRQCGQHTEIILPDGQRQNVYRITWQDNRFQIIHLAPFKAQTGLTPHLTCP